MLILLYSYSFFYYEHKIYKRYHDHEFKEYNEKDILKINQLEDFKHLKIYHILKSCLVNWALNAVVDAILWDMVDTVCM